MSSRERCGTCTRPRATQRDYDTLPAQEGDGLCWGDWDSHQCLAGKPTPEEREDRIRADERAKVVEEIAAFINAVGRTYTCSDDLRRAIAREFGGSAHEAARSPHPPPGADRADG